MKGSDIRSANPWVGAMFDEQSMSEGYKASALRSSELVIEKSQEITKLNNEISRLKLELATTKYNLQLVKETAKKMNNADTKMEKMRQHMAYQDERIVEQRKMIKELQSNIDELKAGEYYVFDTTMSAEVVKVYGARKLYPPNGFAIRREFRKLRVGDHYLGTDGNAYRTNSADAHSGLPRLVLKKVDPEAKAYNDTWWDTVADLDKNQFRIPFHVTNMVLLGVGSKPPVYLFGESAKVYGSEKIDAPAGYTFTGEFRTPKVGECSLDPNTYRHVSKWTSEPLLGSNYKALILKPEGDGA